LKWAEIVLFRNTLTTFVIHALAVAVWEGVSLQADALLT
jgi:hypothetical protein